MRVVVAGVNENGRSYFLSDHDFKPTPQAGRIWKSSPPFDLPDPRTVIAETLEPDECGSKVGVVTIQPTSTDEPPPTISGMDVDGFHVTRTIDYDYVISGELTLVLDEAEVTLRAGDVAVIQAARHAWRCRSNQAAQFLSVLVSLLSQPQLGG